MSDLFGNHILGYPTRWLIFLVGVTVIQTSLKYNVDVTWNEFLEVKYFDASHSQVRKLVEVSKFCYISFKYTCIRTKVDFDDHLLLKLHTFLI